MESPQSGGVHSFQAMGSSSGRLVCFGSQSQTGDLLLPLSIPQGIDQGRFFSELGRFLDGLHVSSSGDSPQGSQPGQEKQSQGNSNCSEVACQTMVLDDFEYVGSDSIRTSGQGESVVTVPDPASQSRLSQPSGMEDKRAFLRERGFQEGAITTILAAKATSTVSCYEARWKAFVGWCGQRSENPLETSVACIAEFLQEMFDKGRAWSTVKGYVAAISAFHPRFHECSLGSDKSIKDFIEGVYKLRPPVKAIVPTWDLGLVLQALTSSPFEPHGTACLQAWTWKTAFLLAITSAARVSELQALDSRPELLRCTKYKAVLRLNPAFLPKVPTPEHLNREIELEAFYPDARGQFEKALQVLCPVRALRIYLRKTQGIRKDHQLLVSYQAGKQGVKVTKSTVSRWVKQTILFCYRNQGRAIPTSSVRAHSTRAVASSLADIKGVSPADLCAAATWSSSSVFAKHYRLDMAASRSISSQVLSAAVAGKS